MKKAILALVVLSAFTLVSCKKEYTCACKKIYTDADGSTTTESDGTYTFKDTRPRAETKCNEQEGSGTDIFGDYSRECQI